MAVGWGVADGGGSVANGESNGDWNTPSGVAVAVGDAVAVAVGDGLAVALGRPGEGDGGSSSVDKPQPDRIAANVAAPAPFRKRRRLRGNRVSDMSPIVPANPAPVNHASATVRLHLPYGAVQNSTDTSSR